MAQEGIFCAHLEKGNVPFIAKVVHVHIVNNLHAQNTGAVGKYSELLSVPTCSALTYVSFIDALRHPFGCYFVVIKHVTSVPMLNRGNEIFGNTRDTWLSCACLAAQSDGTENRERTTCCRVAFNIHRTTPPSCADCF